MLYDLVSEGMVLLVNFMKKVLEKDPRGRLIKIRSITLHSKEDSGDFNFEELTEEFECYIKSLKVQKLKVCFNRQFQISSPLDLSQSGIKTLSIEAKHQLKMGFIKKLPQLQKLNLIVREKEEKIFE